MTNLSVVIQLVLADLLERTRRYSFLIALAVMVYLGYLAVPPIESNMLTVDLGGIRGVYNSAWIGSMIVLLSSMVLSLPGFYLVKNAIERDRETAVGQIIATTTLSKPLYTLGKALSNGIFLAVMIAVVAAAAGGMQLVRGESIPIQVRDLAAPFLFATLPTLMLVAAAAVLFESIKLLRGGFGNVAYFVLWVATISIALSGVSFDRQGVIQGSINDPFGASVIGTSMHQAARAVFPEKALDLGVGYTRVEGRIQTFRWEGVRWTADLLLKRSLWIGVALGLALMSALFFNRFDTARGGRRKRDGSEGWIAHLLAPLRSLSLPGWLGTGAGACAQGSTSWSRLAGRLSVGTPPLPPFGRVLVAELRLMLKGLPWWWYLGALGLIVAGLTVGGPQTLRGLLSVAWIWPILVWSGLGVREREHRTGAMVFSAPRPLGRQFVTMWSAGALVTLLAGSGVGLRLLIGGSWDHLLGWAAAVLFIPTLAVALGTWSASSKFFEALYVTGWYIGPVNQFVPLDFMSLSDEAIVRGMPAIVFTLSAAGGRCRVTADRAGQPA